MWHDIFQFFTSHRSGVIDSLLAAALLVLFGSTAALLRARSLRHARASVKTFGLVRDIYRGKNGWSRSGRDRPRIMVVGNYLVTNVSSLPATVARVEGKVGRKRVPAAMSQFVDRIPPGATVPISIGFFCESRIKSGSELVANIAFLDSTRDRTLAPSRAFSVPSGAIRGELI